MIKGLQDYFGIPVNEVHLDSLKGLPFYLTADRKLQKLEIAGEYFLVVNIADDEKYGVPALRKQLKKYYEMTGLNVVFSFSGMNRVQRNALLKANIPFIALPEQVYLPFIGILFSNRFREKCQIKKEKMMPVTQQVFLYLLYNRNKESLMKSAVADALGITRTSVTRATEQLMQMSIITQEKAGKEIYIRCQKCGKDLYESAKPFLMNPIQEEIYVDSLTVNHGLLKTGETALGEQTMLNPPKILEFAVYKGSEIVKSFHTIDERWEADGNTVRIQLWKYNPCLFSDNEYVDPVSLICCFKDNNDERIQIQIDEFTEGMKW